MADKTRTFEGETIAHAGLTPPATKVEAGEIPGAATPRLRRKEGPDKTQNRVIVLRLIKFFEQDPAGFGDL